MKNNFQKITFFTGIFFILLSLGVAIFLFFSIKNERCVLSDDAEVANISVANLSSQVALQRLNSIYLHPIKILVDDTFFYLDPREIGFSIDSESMINEALSPCRELGIWKKFLKKIFNQPYLDTNEVELIWNFDHEIYRNYVDQSLRPRYDISASFSYPIKGTTQFVNGNSGRKIDVEKLQNQLFDALLSPDLRSLALPFQILEPNRLTQEMLVYQLNQVLIDQSFSGLVEVYGRRLSDQFSVNFASSNQQMVSPNIAFTAASTMKIPIMVSSLARSNLPLSDLQQGWLNYMIIYSENDPADRLMEQIDAIRGPLIVTEDMQTLGLESTFIAGYFYLGAPLLDLYQTPSNQRVDININADLYNQTTPEEIGKLLSLIYECSENRSSFLISSFSGELNQEKCNLMVDVLSRNRIGALIESGLPEGTRIAHKHGWSEEQDGLIHTFSDVGIIFGPEHDYVLTVFIYSPNQLLFDTANLLTAQLSQVVFNFMNPNYQIVWKDLH